MNSLDKQYTDLLQDILDNGISKSDRTGTGTISVFGRQIRHKMSEGFPLVTTKRIPFQLIATELIWFLRGDTNIKFLIDNNCHIWNGDAYKSYIQKETERTEKTGKTWTPLTIEEFANQIKNDDEFAKKYGELGSIYGKQWRSWKTYRKLPKDDYTTDYRENEPIDQITNLINDLKTNPDSRRLMVTAWNPADLESSVLPPCHYGFQVYTRELSSEERLDLFKVDSIDRIDSYNKWLDDNGYPKRAISLMWNQRSCDTFLGLPFNIASYGLLLEIIAKAVNMVPDELIGNLGDTHLYSNHIEQAKEQIGRELTHEERRNLLKDEMSHRIYNKTVNELMAFGSGMSEYYESYNIPQRTREPYPLPNLNINTEFWLYEGGSCGEGPLDAVGIFKSFTVDNFCQCLLEEDLQLGNYQSHATIKAPLSN